MQTIVLFVMTFGLPAMGLLLFLMLCRWLWRAGSR